MVSVAVVAHVDAAGLLLFLRRFAGFLDLFRHPAPLFGAGRREGKEVRLADGQHLAATAPAVAFFAGFFAGENGEGHFPVTLGLLWLGLALGSLFFPVRAVDLPVVLFLDAQPFADLAVLEPGIECPALAGPELEFARKVHFGIELVRPRELGMKLSPCQGLVFFDEAVLRLV